MTQHNPWADGEGNKGQEVEEDEMSKIHLQSATAPDVHDPSLRLGFPATNGPVPTFQARAMAERDPSLKRQVERLAEDVMNYERPWMLSLRKFAGGLRLVHYPLSFLVVLMIGCLMAGMPISKPHCIIPGISDSPFCQPLYTGVDFPALVAAETKTVDQLENVFVGGSLLSLQLKQSEVAMRDLVTLVRVSDLTAKDLLGATLMDFVHYAHKTGKGLQGLSSKFGGAIDNIITINEYSLKLIESARAPLSVFALVAGRKPTKAIVTKAFENAMHTISINLERLILEAEASEKNLMDLEVNLSSLHEIVTQETTIICDKTDKVLWELSTFLGRNRRTLRNLDLLLDIGTYRDNALGHVVSALQALRAMQQDMEDIRDRAAAPDLIGRSVPVEVHMNSLAMGLQRLKDGRLQTKTLEEKEVRRILSNHQSKEP